MKAFDWKYNNCSVNSLLLGCSSCLSAFDEMTAAYRDVREITKSSWLQQVVRSKKKIGLLLSRKKNEKLGLELQWVVLCVHNDQVPLLEWYPNDQGVGAHRPLKLLDLFECLSITNIMEGENRSFLITFKDADRPQIELAAMTSNDRDEWVQILTYTLSRLECLEPNSNLYSPMPTMSVNRPTSNLLDDDEEGNEHSRTPRLSFPMPLLPYGQPELDRGVPLLDDAPRTPAPPPPGATHVPEIEYNNYEHINRGVHLMPDEEGSSAESAKAPNVIRNGDGSTLGRNTLPGRPSSSPSSKVESSTIRRREERPPLPPRQSDSIRASSLSMLGRRSTGQSDQLISHYDVPRISGTPIYDVLPPIAESSSSKRTSSATTATTSDSWSLSHNNSRPTSTGDLDGVFEANVSNRVSPSPVDDSNNFYENAHSPRPTSGRGLSVTEDDYAERYHSPISPPATLSLSHPLRLSAVPPPPTSIDSPPPLPPRGNLERSPHFLDRSSTEPLYSETRETLNRLHLSSARQHEVDVARREMSRSVKVQISVGDCVDGLALVEVNQRLWVAGWSQKYDKRLSAAFHIGDQVKAVNNTSVTSASQIPAVYYADFTPGLPITFDVHRQPNGRVHFITKRPNQQLGIVFVKGKNKINTVEAGSAAAEAGVEANIQSFFDSAKTCPSVVTELNGRPLSLFARNNNDLNGRLAAVDGEITIMIQPYDFVKALKTQLKTKCKNYKHYIVA